MRKTSLARLLARRTEGHLRRAVRAGRDRSPSLPPRPQIRTRGHGVEAPRSSSLSRREKSRLDQGEKSELGGHDAGPRMQRGRPPAEDNGRRDAIVRRHRSPDLLRGPSLQPRRRRQRRRLAGRCSAVGSGGTLHLHGVRQEGRIFDQIGKVRSDEWVAPKLAFRRLVDRRSIVVFNCGQVPQLIACRARRTNHQSGDRTRPCRHQQTGR